MNKTSRTPVLTAAFRRVFSFPVLLGATLALSVLLVTSATGPGKLFVEGDVWWHVATGQLILSTGHLPTVDPYSFTVHGHPWMAYEWLGEMLMAAAVRLDSLQGLQILLVLLSAILVVLTFCYAWFRTRNPLASAAAVALLLQVEQPMFTLRPQMLGYIFLMLTLISLDLFKQGRLKSLWFLPVIFTVWVNTHGSFVLGLFFVACYWASGLVSFQWGNLVADRWEEGKRRHLLLVSLLSGLALFVTPYGTRLATYPFELMLIQPLNVRYVVEWRQLDLSTSWGQAFLIVLLAWIAAQVISPIVYRLEILAPLLLLTYESLVHFRFLLVFVPLFAPIMATYLARWLPGYDAAKERYAMNVVFIAAILLAGVALLPSNKKLQETLRRTYPVGAVEYLRAHPLPSGMFNDDHWGGFLIWSLGPQHKVFIDGRLDIYEYAGVLADYVSIARADQSTFVLFQRYGIRACLLPREGPLVAKLAGSPDWEKAYEDGESVIFLRRGNEDPKNYHPETNELHTKP
ncbi:MAG: hypothetical protein WCA20_10165 [Candidatus Sulfotelmatobacter sp.]